MPAVGRSKAPRSYPCCRLNGQKWEGIMARDPCEAAMIYAEYHGIHYGDQVVVYDFVRDTHKRYRVTDDGALLVGLWGDE